MKKFGWSLLVLFLVGGVLFSVIDYRKWKHAETDNYGHGPGEMVPAWTLGQLYQNQIARLRIRYPDGWRVFTYGPYRNTGVEAVGLPEEREVVRFFEVGGEKETGVDVKVQTWVSGANVVDEVNKVIKKEKLSGWHIEGEQRHWQAGEVPVTVVIFRNGDKVQLRGWGKFGGKIVSAEWSGVMNSLNRYEGTFKGMWDSAVVF